MTFGCFAHWERSSQNERWFLSCCFVLHMLLLMRRQDGGRATLISAARCLCIIHRGPWQGTPSSQGCSRTWPCLMSAHGPGLIIALQRPTSCSPIKTVKTLLVGPHHQSRAYYCLSAALSMPCVLRLKVFATNLATLIWNVTRANFKCNLSCEWINVALSSWAFFLSHCVIIWTI